MTYKPGPKTGLVTHKGCLDGTGSALMFLLAGGERANIMFKNTNDCNLTVDEASRFDEVWFADLCPKATGVLSLADSDVAGGKPFHVFDHHISNIRLYDGDPNCTFSTDHSGTSLMARELGIKDDNRYNQIGDLISALEAYDLGRFGDKHGMQLADLAASYSQEEMLEILYRNEWDVIVLPHYRGRADGLAASRNIYADSVAEKIRTRQFEGFRLGIVTSPIYWKNEVALRVLKDPTIDVAVVIDPTSGAVSLRSRQDGPDCSRIAGKFGGGGHPRAAGFHMKGSVLLDVLFEAVFG